MKIFDSIQLNVVVSNRCNIECSHCCMKSSPSRISKSTHDDIDQIFRDFSLLYEIKMIVLTGGEPSVTGRKLFDIIRTARQFCPNVRLVTNASWAGTQQSAEKFVRKIYDSGVSEIAFSTSEHHQQFIEIEIISRAWHAARALPFNLVAVAASHEFNDDYNQSILNQISLNEQSSNNVHCGNSFVRAGRVQRIGRFESEQVPKGRHNIHHKNPYRLRCPAAVVSPAISADGDLWACVGMDLTDNEFLNFGTITPENASHRFQEMQHSTIPMAIRYLGPGFLLKFIAAKDGLVYRKDLISFCEVCQDLTRKPEFKEGLLRHEAEIRVLLRQKMQELGLPDIDSIEENAPAPGSPVQARPSS